MKTEHSYPYGSQKSSKKSSYAYARVRIMFEFSTHFASFLSNIASNDRIISSTIFLNYSDKTVMIDSNFIYLGGSFLLKRVNYFESMVDLVLLQLIKRVCLFSSWILSDVLQMIFLYD